MKRGLVLFAIGVVLLTLGIFTIFDRGVVSRPSYVVGLVLTTVGFLRLSWLGWQGSLASSVVAAVGAFILTWIVYELIRQSPPLPPIGFLGEMTAPVLSATAGLIVVAIGLIRARGHRPAPAPTAEGASVR